MRIPLLAIALVGSLASSAGAADGINGTWMTTGPGTQTFVFKVQGDRFTGLVCGPCDNPATVFRVDGGRVESPERFTFTVHYDVGGPLFSKGGPYRALVMATLTGSELTLRARKDGESESSPAVTLRRVVGEGVVPVTMPATPSPLAGQSGASPLDGKWVAAGRVSQQNFVLKVSGSQLWGLVCGPCNPDGVFMIDDGRVDGNTIVFYINHIDTPPSPSRTGLNRNIMRGTLNGNVMKFTWVREGAENEPGGEMTLIGPIR